MQHTTDKTTKYTRCLKIRSLFIFWISPSKTSNYYDFCTQHSENIWYQKFINLPTSPVYCGRIPWEVPKSHISTILFICASECLGYWMKQITAVTVQPSERSSLTANARSDFPSHANTIITESVTPLFDRLIHNALLAFSPCLNQPLQQPRLVLGTYTRSCITSQMSRPTGFTSGLLAAGHMSGLMKSGVAWRRSSTVSRTVRCLAETWIHRQQCCGSLAASPRIRNAFW